MKQETLFTLLAIGCLSLYSCSDDNDDFVYDSKPLEAPISVQLTTDEMETLTKLSSYLKEDTVLWFSSLEKLTDLLGITAADFPDNIDDENYSYLFGRVTLPSERCFLKGETLMVDSRGLHYEIDYTYPSSGENTVWPVCQKYEKQAFPEHISLLTKGEKAIEVQNVFPERTFVCDKLDDGQYILIQDYTGLQTYFSQDFLSSHEILNEIDFTSSTLVIGRKSTLYILGGYTVELVQTSAVSYVANIYVSTGLGAAMDDCYYGFIVDKVPEDFIFECVPFL